MSRRLPKYVQGWLDRDGRAHHYFRRRGYPRVPLPGLPWSAEFMTARQQAMAEAPLPIGTNRSKPGSVNMAVAAFYGSQRFVALAPRTKQMRRAILERFRAEHGDKPIASMPQKFLVALLSTMKPFAARTWLKTLRQLLQYAVELQLRSDDPTQGIKLVRVKTNGFHTWTEDEIAAFETYHPNGSKARLALALGLYTVQRRSDVIRMGRQHIHDGVLTVKQQKTGVTLAIPLHPALQAIIEATPAGHLTLLIDKDGKPYNGNNFSEQFRRWCDAAGLPEACKFHGLRKAGCRRLAEAGCSANEIAAISGHATLHEVERYTKAADQARMARNALARTVKGRFA